ncbi:MobH family relaxase [Diaphorobacter sp. J5-51]|uniref:MobH family relaxase n=1 Tax=Diaphorobacter sp. J5-51 TaxID=680496 RepID=UPI00069C3F3A|nr:MobH family relaxase [Diaphorobacter sp. J5-51]
MLSWVKKLARKTAPTSSAPTPEHLKIAILKKDIPRYPPFMKGLPVERPDEIVAVQDELLTQIYQSTKVTSDVFQRHYRGAIDRFARFVHLLPASQAHHHRGAGGLLRHSLEVGLWSLREADKMLLLELFKTPGHRREIEPRWLLTAFLAGLCHDVGKPATDVIVKNHGSTKQWNPIERSLWDWATREGIDAYFLEWQSGRAKHHVALTGAIAKNIITDETLAWIAGESPQLMVWLMETLNGTPGNTNPLFDIVIKADQKSVERDLKSMGAVMAGYDLGVPVERMLTDIMRRLIRQGIWSVNEPGAKVWNIEGNIYLVWPTSGQDIAQQVHQDGIPGVPRNADSILDMLVERGLAFTDTNGLYKIAPAVLAAKIPDIKLNCIRLRDDTLISTDPIASVDGKVIADVAANDAGQPNAAQAQAEPVKVGEAVDSTQAGADSKAAIAQPVPGQQAPTGADTQASAQTKQQKAGPKHAAAVSVPMAALPLNKVEHIDPETGEIQSTAPPTIPVGEARIPPASAANATAEMVAAAAQKSAQPKKPQPRQKPNLVLDGVVGEALKALAEDLKTGAKLWGSHAIVEDDERVLLVWPDAFSGYGLTPSAIINDLSAKKWCWSDPMIPTKKVIEIDVQGSAMRAIRLHHDVSEAVLYAAGHGLSSTGEPDHAEGGTTVDAKPAAAPHREALVAVETPQPPKKARQERPQEQAGRPEDTGNSKGKGGGAAQGNPKPAREPGNAGKTPAEATSSPARVEKSKPTKPDLPTQLPATPSPETQTAPQVAEPKRQHPRSEPKAAPAQNQAPKQDRAAGANPSRSTPITGAAPKEILAVAQAPKGQAAIPTQQEMSEKKLALFLKFAKRHAGAASDDGWFEAPMRPLSSDIEKETGLEINRAYFNTMAKEHPGRVQIDKRVVRFRA